MISRQMAGTRTGRQPRRLVLALILGALTGLGPFSIDAYLPALPLLTEDLRTTPSMAQLTLTACLLGLALGQLVTGPVSDSHGRRRPLLLGLLIYGFASVMCVWTRSIGLFIVLRFFQGLAGSAGIVIARAIARDYYEGKELTRFFALLMLVNGVAPVLAPVLGGILLRFTSWHGVFIMLALLSISLLLIVLSALPESLPPQRRVQGGLQATIGALGSLATNAGFMGYVLTQGFAYAAMFGYISGSSFVLQEEYGVSPQVFSVIFAVNATGLILAGQAGAIASGRWDERRVLVASLIIAVAGSLALLFAVLGHANLAIVLISLFVAIAIAGAVGTTCTSLALQNQGRVAGSASAWLGVTGMLLGALVSPLVGLGFNRIAVSMAAVIVLCHLAAALAYWLLAARGSGARVEKTLSQRA
ncbi:multidrug effflux MFS transporter [Moorella sulfitireducens (nom. illeg.)]|uniref:multidrug effflux MFS transporter n=1 Tax=Neomoorella sulfitireducens TaxID=2972948 RepID=UPI0021ABF004|nr:multidrug effflux MFS transporter [Moorella sulfitireducens]